MQKLRVALYSHDAMGMGHMRRNLLIARTLARAPLEADVLLVTGAGEFNLFPLEPGIDSLTLPALCKTTRGDYGSRRLKMPLAELVSLRAEMIRTAVHQFRPHVFIADKSPRGIMNELDPVLELLALRGDTRCILGLRDILDDPAQVCMEWLESDSDNAVREFYDAVWVYGDPAVYDALAEYQFSADVAARVHYTGYLDPRDGGGISRRRRNESHYPLPSDPFVLCQVGGGQDGEQLVRSFARAARPEGTQALILTGPYMPERTRRELQRAAECQPDLTVMEFESCIEPLLHRCDRVVSMGGYNTLCETLVAGKSALVVPRVRPRTEQLIRAERFRDLGLIEMLHPDDATPAAISEWLAVDIPFRRSARETIDFSGTRRLPELLTALLDGTGRGAPEVQCLA